MKKLITNYIDRLKTTLDNLDKNEIERFINELLKARDNGKNIFIMGNGGSASTASHFVCDFNKGMSYKQDKKFKFHCLNDNIATMLAYANDVSYDDVFVEQLKNFMEEGDLVIGISGSGNSKNVIKAIDYANQNGGVSIGLTGYDGGLLKKLAKYSVNANIKDMQISEDVHMMLGHMIYYIHMELNEKMEMELTCD